MTGKVHSGLFICEGTSDLPLAEIVEALFIERGVDVRLSRPDYSLLRNIPKDVKSRVRVGIELIGGSVDLVVVHRDADSTGPQARRKEITDAVESIHASALAVPVIPVRMTEAWLLLDENAIRRVAGNPRGRTDLGLPVRRKVESVADPKQLLQQCLVKAADCAGRRRDQVAKRFNEHRRQLLQQIDYEGPVTDLPSWQQLIIDIDAAVAALNCSK
ncbi:hypothetical protein [Nocardia amikacinitolerans]|uniref:hypothetical protein n=1 Tax=Nocardia amikacinitolerans TaxID=756689 RepID=UPI0020A608FD|nr:hypothetical protein [Nocardia amikacinitolerans]MCP2287518.1 protein of unknown function (DUF4276) [Nocardia amikacinitolerans]